MAALPKEPAAVVDGRTDLPPSPKDVRGRKGRIYISVFEIIGRTNYHALNRPQIFCHVNM